MYKKRTKIIASMLVIILTMAHLNIIGEVLASSLENQVTTTRQANVEFDVYFKSETSKQHTAIKTIGENNYLYATITVKEAGYLKDIVLETENANYTIAETKNDQIAKIEENKLYLNKIQNGNTVEIAIPIQIVEKNTITLEELSKESKVKLKATYVNEKGEEKQVEKEITVHLSWTKQAEAELNMQIAKFIPYEIDGNKGLVLQVLAQSNLKENSLPVKESKIETTIPTINNQKPEQIKVVANSTKATNGDETGVNFTEANYKIEENKLTITTKNEIDEQKNIAWVKNAQDEYIITYIYSEEVFNSLQDNGVKIAITTNSEITTYDVNSKPISKTLNGEVTLKDQISNLVDFNIQTEITQLSKGQLYANYQVANKIETEYKETWIVNIGLAELTDSISLEQKAGNLVVEDGNKLELAASYYKTINVNKQEVEKILGQEGEINFFSGTTKIATINKESKEEDYTIDVTKLNINTLRIETSKPIAEGKINFHIVKAIKGEIGLAKTQIKAASKLEVNLIGTASSGEETFVNQSFTKEISLIEPSSKAELTIDHANLSTVVTNQNVKITAILRTDTLDCMLYQNPSLQITLPNYIENMNIKNVEVLFDTENSKLTLKSYEIVQNADGTKTIVISLEGTQTEYTLGAVSKGVNIVITSDITVNKFTPNKQDKITMVYTNNNVITIARANMQEVGEVVTTFNVVAPTGVVTTNTIHNYVENAESLTSISGEEKIATIPILTEARNANFSMEVMNNYNNTIDHISILGRTLFARNKDIVSASDLGSTMNMPLVSNIKVAGVEANKVTIYYSENANATKEVNVASNGWTTSPTNLANVKSYLIVLNDTTMNTGDHITFDYTAQIPANLQHNQSAYENYVVYFNNNLETGVIEDKQVATKVGLTTGRGPVIETSISTNISETEEKLTGSIIPYTLTVKNTGTETAQNVVATIHLPSGLQYVELEEGKYTVKQMQGEANITLGNIEAGKTVEKEIYMKVGILSASEDTKVVETKASITASNIEGTLETQTVKNTLARTHFILTPTVLKEREVLRENDNYTYYLEVLSSSIYETKQDTVLTIKLPKEIVYESVEIKNKVKNSETDITESTTYKYDSKTRTLTINLKDVDGNNPKVIYLKVKVGKLEENVYDKTINIDATISAKDARTQSANIESVQIGKIGFKITQSSNIPENTSITAEEDLKYIFTIENLSNIDLYNVTFTDHLPEELTLNHMKLTRESGNTINSYQNSMNINLKGKEKVTIEVNVSVNMIDETKTVSNNATLAYEGIDTIQTSSYQHVIQKFDVADFDDGNQDPSNPSNQTKRIMGTVWIDKNANGMKDEGEEKVPNVEMLLFNNQTGKLVTNRNGNIVRTTTDENGSYTFSGIAQGKYTVIFLYDTANYSATTYHKEKVDSSINSDAVDTNITLDGVTRVAAITEEIAITDSNIYNIDLGLVSNPKFDLKLDKTVSKITVQDATGTNVYSYQDSKLAKKDLVGKQIANTTIIVEYKITVTNEGAISGFVKKIADYMPKEMKFNSELNKDWYTSENGVLYNSSLANTIINPGERKEVTLILTKKMTEDNLGLYHNEAEIYESYNDLGIADVDSTPGNKISTEDDISSADVLITVKTGKVILFVGLILTIIIITGIGAYVIKKKVIR